MTRVALLIAFLWLQPVRAQWDREFVMAARHGTVMIMTENGSGSGFLIAKRDDHGYVMTNHHVVHGMGNKPVDRLSTIFDAGTSEERVFLATLVAADATRDLAVLSIRGLPQGYTLAKLAKTEPLEGDPALTIGFPFGRDLRLENWPAPSFTKGFVTGTHYFKGQPNELRVIDLHLNPGNSGGPIYDENGLVCGVAVAGVLGTRYCMMIPITQVSEFLKGNVEEASFNFFPSEKGWLLKAEVSLADPLGKVVEIGLNVLPTSVKPSQSKDEIRKSEKPLAIASVSGERQIHLEANIPKTRQRHLGLQAWIKRSDGSTQYMKPKFLPLPQTRVGYDWGDARDNGSDWLDEVKPLREKKVSRRLPGVAMDTAMAGSGRYLVIRLEDDTLAIFDLAKGHVARMISIDEDNYLYTAGGGSLVVYMPQSRRFDHYDLDKREPPRSIPFETIQPKALSMGMGNGRRMLIASKKSYYKLSFNFFDLKTNRIFHIKTDKEPTSLAVSRKFSIQASSDARLFMFSGMQAYRLLDTSGGHNWEGYKNLSRDILCQLTDTGRVFSPNGAVYNKAGETVFIAKHHGALFAATDASVYLELNASNRSSGDPYKITLNSGSTYTPLIDFPMDINIGHGNIHLSGGFPMAKRLYILPAANRVISFSQSLDRLLFYRLDLKESLQALNEPFLVLVDTPINRARRGSEYRHTLRAVSDSGLYYSLLEGPPGMSISQEGVIHWQVPEFSLDDYLITIFIENETGASTLFRSTLMLD